MHGSLISRTILVAAGATLLLTLAPPATAQQTERFVFDYGKQDQASSYWVRQFDEEVTVPVPEGAPVEPSQRVRLPNPNGADALPVTVVDGEHERMSALALNLFDRGVTAGSEIHRYKVTIEEGSEGRERPLNADDAEIEACRIEAIWPAGENERWEDRPPFSEADCVDGKRRQQGDDPAEWTFDLTDIAEPWGTDPFDSHGVMLKAVNPKGNDTWHVSLMIPARDDSETEEDEYRQTRNRVQAVLTFTPGEEDLLDLPPVDTGTTFTGTGGGFSPSTDFTGGDLTTTTTDTEPVEEVAAAPETPEAAPVAVTQPVPRVPPYVWLLIPLGLLGLAAVRSVVMEPVGGMRPDGVVAAIRRRNIERRGGPLRDIPDPLAAAGAMVGRGWTAARKGAAGIGRAFSSVTRKVRKS